MSFGQLLASKFNTLKNSLFRYGQSEGKMLIHLGALGWFLSSAAQTVAICVNDKISKKDKKFLIPQEICDGVVNVACYYGITRGVQSLTNKLLDSGKIVFKDASGSVMNPSKFKSPMGVIAVIVGSIISCNIVTPIVRNFLASKIQAQKIKNDVPVNPYVTFFDYSRINKKPALIGYSNVYAGSSNLKI